MHRVPLLALALALALLTLTACNQGGIAGSGEPATVRVEGAICRPTPVGRQMTGCYLTLTTTTADRLVTVSSPDANLVQIHESRIESGMMMMGELREGLPLPAGEAVALAPGGNHLMLMGVAEPLVAGDTVALTLTFETSPRLGHGDVAGVRLDGAERIVGGLGRRRLRQGVEQGGLADIGQADDRDFQGHGLGEVPREREPLAGRDRFVSLDGQCAMASAA